MEPEDLNRRDFRVIAEGDAAVGKGLTLDEALAVLDYARQHRKRYVAIVDDSTGALVDELSARRLVEGGSEPPAA